MRFLTRLFFVFIFFGWAGYLYAYDVEIEWRPSSDGRTMSFKVLSVNSSLNNNSQVNCGLFSACYVHMGGGSISAGATFYLDFPKISGFRGVNPTKKVADAWGRTSPSGYIGNWGEMVDKIGSAPCFAFDMRGPSGEAHLAILAEAPRLRLPSLQNRSRYPAI